jgi:transcriptional regulator with XRE-family HTH domain
MGKLARYLKDRKQRDFAEAVGISSAFLSQILKGDRRPGYETMLRIEEATGGEVDIHSWRNSEVTGQ